MHECSPEHSTFTCVLSAFSPVTCYLCFQSFGNGCKFLNVSWCVLGIKIWMQTFECGPRHMETDLIFGVPFIWIQVWIFRLIEAIKILITITEGSLIYRLCIYWRIISFRENSAKRLLAWAPENGRKIDASISIDRITKNNCSWQVLCRHGWVICGTCTIVDCMCAGVSDGTIVLMKEHEDGFQP